MSDTHKTSAPEPRLHAAAKLILAERDNLADSAPRATLLRLEALARELREIESRL